MDTEALELFAEVMRTRSFTEVARALRIAPSSVSRTITALENELGIRLFQRSTRRLEPTEAGVVYFERISPLLGELQSAREMAADLSEEPTGTLRLTAATVFGQMHIVPLLPAIQERYPSLSVELVLTDAYLDLIEEHIDLAIRLGTLQDSSHIARRLKDVTFYICASRAYLDRFGTPIAPQEITDHECLLFPRQGHNLNWSFRSATGDVTEVPIRGRYLITNSQAIRDSAKAGMGLTLLPDWLVEDDIRSGELIHLFADFDVTATDFQSAVWLIRPSRDYVPLKTRVFTEHLVENLRSPTDTAV